MMTQRQSIADDVRLRAQRVGRGHSGRLLVLAALVALTAGCGDDPERADSDTSPDIAPCSEVWVVGETLPEDYVACDDGTEGYDLSNGYWHCADGTEVWQNGKSGYFASQGTVIRADDDGSLHSHLDACGALDGTS